MLISIKTDITSTQFHKKAMEILLKKKSKLTQGILAFVGNTEMQIFTFFFLLSLAVFSTFPVNDSLPSDSDSILNLAIYRTIYNQLSGFFSGANTGMWCYPAHHVEKLVSIDIGGGIVFLLIDKIVGNILWSWWLFISLIYALNAFGFSLILAELDIKLIVPRIAGGIFFAFSTYCIGNIDNVNFINLSLSLIGIAIILQGIKKKSSKLLGIGLLFHTSEIYISPYGFFFFSFVILFLLADKIRATSILIFNLRFLPFLALAGILVVFYGTVFLGIDHKKYFNGLDTHYLPIIYLYSFNFSDLVNVNQNNLVFSHQNNIFDNAANNGLHECYPGISLVILALIGSFRFPKYLILYILGLIMASGPYLNFGYSHSIISPLKGAYVLFHDYIRLPVRWYIISQFAMAILGTYGFYFLYNKLSNKFPVILIPILFFLEQVPVHFSTYNSISWLNYDAKALEQIANDKGMNNLAFLPSSLFSNGYKGGRREHIYMYWQTIHKKNIINGDIAYIPPERMKNNIWMSSPSSNYLDSIINNNNIDGIVLSFDSPLDSTVYKWQKVLDRFPRTIIKYRTDRAIIYSVRK